MLPEQYRHKLGLTPERRLLLAVLEEAVSALFRHVRIDHPRSRAIVEEALFWIASKSMTHPCHFAMICEAVDIEASYLRAGIRKALASGKQVSTWDFRREPLRRKRKAIVKMVGREAS